MYHYILDDLEEYLNEQMEYSISDKGESTMSSGRDEWMASWSQETKREIFKPKTPLERALSNREVLFAELDRLNNYIKELQSEEA